MIIGLLAAGPPTHEWGEFYLVVGGAAGALTGLMFVVITLGAENRRQRGIEAFETYATPTIVHLATVLFLACVITVPGHSELSLALCLAATGIAGLGYTAWIVVQTKRTTGYSDYLSDWIWRDVLPGGSYLTFIIAVPVIWLDDEAALYVLAAGALVLLFSGIHNAWDSAIWIAAEHPED